MIAYLVTKDGRRFEVNLAAQTRGWWYRRGTGVGVPASGVVIVLVIYRGGRRTRATFVYGPTPNTYTQSTTWRGEPRLTHVPEGWRPL